MQKLRKNIILVALDTIRNYIYNSRLSISMSEQDYSFERLKKDIAEIDELQNMYTHMQLSSVSQGSSVYGA